MNKTETIEFLQVLIRYQSDSRNGDAQRRIQSYIAGTLTERDVRLIVESDLSSDLPWTMIRTHHTEGPMLVFACHVDTVPTGDDSTWKYPPFAGIVADNMVHGRGSVDMKGGIAAAASAVLQAAQMNRNVALLLTSDEEVGSLGAPGATKALENIEVGAVIIPEATDNHIVLGHRGALWLKLESIGLAAHGSTPHRGINAALNIGRALARADHELPLSHDDLLGHESWNLGVLNSGIAPNIVPEHAEAIVDMRTTTNGSELLSWWKAQPEINLVSIMLSLSPLRTISSRWVASLSARVAAKPAAYFTDGSVLADFLPGVPVIVWGPGDPRQMHARDESLTIESLEKAYEQFHETVDYWWTP